MTTFLRVHFRTCLTSPFSIYIRLGGGGKLQARVFLRHRTNVSVSKVVSYVIGGKGLHFNIVQHYWFNSNKK